MHDLAERAGAVALRHDVELDRADIRRAGSRTERLEPLKTKRPAADAAEKRGH